MFELGKFVDLRYFFFLLEGLYQKIRLKIEMEAFAAASARKN